MAHRKESVRPEAEIDYQAKKNLEDKHTRLYKESIKKTEKLRKELKATIPSREHSWPKWLGGYKDTDESKRIKKELTIEHKHRKFIDKREKSLEKLGGDPISKHGTGALEKRRLLKMGVYRDKKGGQVLEMKGGGIALRGLGKAFVKGGKV